MPEAAALPRPLVLADVVPGARVRDAVLVVSGTALTAALAQIAFSIPPSPVPVTGQTLAVGLVGATLGARRGGLALACISSPASRCPSTRTATTAGASSGAPAAAI